MSIGEIPSERTSRDTIEIKSTPSSVCLFPIRHTMKGMHRKIIRASKLAQAKSTPTVFSWINSARKRELMYAVRA
jgi:hypothetical protein